MFNYSCLLGLRSTSEPFTRDPAGSVDGSCVHPGWSMAHGHSLSLSQGAGADLCWWADSSCNFHPHFSSDSDNVAQIEDWGSVCEAVEIQINACAVVLVVETLSLLMCTSSNCLCCIQDQILLHCTACGSFDFAYPWYTSPQHGACWYHWPCTCTPSVCFLQTLTDVAALTRCALYFRADASC